MTIYRCIKTLLYMIYIIEKVFIMRSELSPDMQKISLSILIMALSIPISVFVPLQLSFSQSEESDDGFIESCPECNGGKRYYHHHSVYCAIIENPELSHGSAHIEEDDIITFSGYASNTAGHYHHRHCK